MKTAAFDGNFRKQLTALDRFRLADAWFVLFSLEFLPLPEHSLNRKQASPDSAAPEFQMNSIRRRAAAFSVTILLSGLTVRMVVAQPPQPESSPTGKQPVEAKELKSERQKPQIVYNLGSASRETAEALHAQSKAADMSLPIDGSMPISLQVARANANANAAAADAAPRAVPAPAPSAAESPEAKHNKSPRRARARSRSAVAPQPSGAAVPKAAEHGHGPQR
jgi:hypothetical protein